MYADSPDCYESFYAIQALVLLCIFLYGRPCSNFFGEYQYWASAKTRIDMSSGKKLIKYNSDVIQELPAWAQEFAVKYCTETVNLYFVHGNIRDFLPHSHKNSIHFVFVKIRDYISEVIFGNRDIIVFYDKSSGVSFCMREMEEAYINTMHTRYPEIPIQEFFSRDPLKAFLYLERYFSLNMGNDLRIVLIIDYAETIIPSDEIGNLDSDDRYCFVTLNRWSHDPRFTNEDISIVMLTENLADVNPRLAASPSTVKVAIPLPSEEIRIKFLTYLQSKEELLLERTLNPERIGKLTSGLNLLNLNQLAKESYNEDIPITLEYLRRKKQHIIENEAGGLLEFLNTEHDLSFIAGHEFVKKRFKTMAKALKQGRTDVLPMGYLLAGPIGTGKSFLVSAFAGEIGIPMVRLQNFRSQWQGTAESNLEKVLNILRAMAPVAVMIDEADAVLGSRTTHDETGSSRIFAQITNFMGNTDYRGKIIWFLITSRPDLLPIDLKRQGRAEEHLALFYPETVQEKIEIFETLQRKLKIKIKDVSFSSIINKKLKFPVSGADIESILVRAKMTATVDNRTMLTSSDIEQTIDDFIPPSYPYEIELQNLIAVLECTSKEMLPKQYQNIPRSKLAAEIQELKQLLGEK